MFPGTFESQTHFTQTVDDVLHSIYYRIDIIYFYIQLC